MARVELGRRTGSFAPGIAVEGKRLIFVSGNVSVDAGGQLVGKGDVGAQTRQIFRNIEAVLAEAGATLRDVVKITTFIVPMERYAEFSAVPAGWSRAGPVLQKPATRPSRSATQRGWSAWSSRMTWRHIASRRAVWSARPAR